MESALPNPTLRMLHRVAKALDVRIQDLIEYEDKKVYKLEEKDDYTIRKDEGKFVIEGEPVERIMRRVNIADNESLYYFQKNLDELGVNQRLKEMGIQEGDIVKIADYELEWED